MIVTIDGPAGAGKSTIARALAQRLGFRFLDTGAMYRAVTLAAMRRGHDWRQADALVVLARAIELAVTQDRVEIDGVDVTREIRSSEVTAATHYAANNPGVREHLVDLQRAAAGGDNIVTEGRDEGTVVFPDAEVKVYLTASPEERARRRVHDLAVRGETASVAEVLRRQTERDRSDATREMGPMVAASDAVEVATDGLTPEQVLDRLESLVRSRMSGAQSP